ALGDIDDLRESVAVEIVDPVERGRGGEQRQVLRALGEQAVEIDLVDAFGRKHRLGDALRRILVEIDVGGAEGQIEVGDHHFGAEKVRHAPGDVVGDGRGTNPALGSDEGDGAAHRIGLGIDEDGRYDRYDIGHRNGRHYVFGNAGAHQLAVEPDVVVMADDDDLRTRVADFRKLPERVEQFLRLAPRFQDDEVRRRRGAVELERGLDAAHVHLQMCLGHAPILGGALDRAGDTFRFAERLYRYPGNGPQRVHRGDLLLRSFFAGEGRFVGEIAHLRSLLVTRDNINTALRSR